jgi:hypothetical protein
MLNEEYGYGVSLTKSKRKASVQAKDKWMCKRLEA